jgi:hypothetical protein
VPDILAMKDSLGREPWWNADRCAPPLGGAAVADATAEYQLRLSAFRFRHFCSFFPFVIRVKAALANASTGICLQPLGMEHRHRRPKDAVLRTAMSVVTVSVSGLPSLGR